VPGDFRQARFSQTSLFEAFRRGNFLRFCKALPPVPARTAVYRPVLKIKHFVTVYGGSIPSCPTAWRQVGWEIGWEAAWPFEDTPTE